MLNSVTWKGFFEFIFFISVIYYIAVGWLYYKHDIKQLINKKKIIGVQTVASFYQSTSSATSITDNTTGNNIPLNTLFDELIQKLSKVISKADKNNFLREELVFSLQLIIEEYLQLHETDFEVPINNYIQTEIENICSIHLSDEELKLLWQG